MKFGVVGGGEGGAGCGIGGLTSGSVWRDGVRVTVAMCCLGFNVVPIFGVV